MKGQAQESASTILKLSSFLQPSGGGAQSRKHAFILRLRKPNFVLTVIHRISNRWTSRWVSQKLIVAEKAHDVRR